MKEVTRIKKIYHVVNETNKIVKTFTEKPTADVTAKCLNNLYKNNTYRVIVMTEQVNKMYGTKNEVK